MNADVLKEAWFIWDMHGPRVKALKLFSQGNCSENKPQECS